ncbi:hypothetical protein [Marinifilum caeruleilacunae]|uniref:Uncharacterized protein n=1 Tax=Marinifilum caeruleilacunae TaxID=2499076 RepID=A0ABX1WUI4_9BACT|nr:hypothetical protein [Marinifilum caeruleilacunae]NOU59599.1 hypothetical protein [Marinifilum caeruleilacunae]
MNQNFEFFKTTMPETRKADYYLGCLDSCVFLDFNVSTDNRISLARISFDGYGCCTLDEKAEFLDRKESSLFIEEMNKENLNQETISTLVKKVIRINKEHIWNDAIEEYGLIEKE